MTPETWSTEMAVVAAALSRGSRVPRWPDDCPECGARMEFRLDDPDAGGGFQGMMSNRHTQQELQIGILCFIWSNVATNQLVSVLASIAGLVWIAVAILTERQR